MTIDFIIIIDIFINFISETIKDVERVVYLKDSAKNYLKSFFIIDVLSVIPLLTYESNNYIYLFKLFRIFRIKRFF